MDFKEVGHLLIRTTTGKIGVIFFLCLIAISFYVGFSYPGNFGRDIWGNPEYWADNPKSAPPSWSNFISSESLVKHSVLMTSKPSEINEFESQRVDTFRLPVNLYEENFPTFLSLSFIFSCSQLSISLFKRPKNSSDLQWFKKNTLKNRYFCSSQLSWCSDFRSDRNRCRFNRLSFQGNY